MGFIGLSGGFYGGALSGLSAGPNSKRDRHREREREVENEWENMRNVIRLVGMFWLIENALQVGAVGDPEGETEAAMGPTERDQCATVMQI